MKRLGKVTAVVLCAFAALAGGSHVLLNLPSSRARLDGALKSRIGASGIEASASPISRISWLGCAEVPSARLSYEYGKRAFEATAEGLSACLGFSDLLLGRLAPSAVTARGLAIEVRPMSGKGHGDEVSRLIGGVLGQMHKKKHAERAPLDFRLRIDGIRAPGVSALEKAGPFAIEGRVVVSGEKVELRGVAHVGGSAPALPIATRVELDLGDTRLLAEMNVDDVPLGELPVQGASKAIQGGRLTAHAVLDATLIAGTVEATVAASTRDLVAASPRLASGPVGPLTAAFEGKIVYDVWSSDLELRPSVFEVNGIKIQSKGKIHLAREKPSHVEIDLGPIDYQSALRALPAALQPPASALFADGPIAFHARIAGPAEDPARWATNATLDLSSLKRLPNAAFDPAHPFVFQPPSGGEEGTPAPAPIEIGPTNPNFVPLDHVPATLVRAVLLAEDSSFYGNSGFDFPEMALAFGESLHGEKAARGASTLTQQLAKNLFLGPEKTIARKVKEALLAVELEATLSKSRILEIYLNAIEWGPGIRGIGPAALHYFGKRPDELAVNEAAFLATIIPNPVRYHLYYDRGGLTEKWKERMGELLAKMRSTGAITEQDYDRAVAAPLVFARGEG